MALKITSSISNSPIKHMFNDPPNGTLIQTSGGHIWYRGYTGWFDLNTGYWVLSTGTSHDFVEGIIVKEVTLKQE